MTSIQWLFDNLKSHFEHDGDLLEVVKISFDQVKEMHKQEIIDAYNKSFELRDKPYSTADKYYQETFVSKGSDATSSQTEISDEEIEKAIDAYFPKTDINSRWGWKLGCEWYREQLKNM